MSHEAPLALLREEPALVATLLRELLGVTVPAFATVEIGDAGFTQVVPAELRADLVVHLRGGPPEHAPVMGVVIEIQRTRDDSKRRSWPIYVAALHGRLRCQTCLIVVAEDESIARWAATPITTVQPGSPFVPLVLGPERIPRLSLERARREPWMAVMSALIHGNQPGGIDTAQTAFAALSNLSEEHADLCYNLICASLTKATRRTLEESMQPSKYQHFTDFYERKLEGAQAMLLVLADRYGAVRDELRARVGACSAMEQLNALAVDIAGATDRATVEHLLARLPSAAASTPVGVAIDG